MTTFLKDIFTETRLTTEFGEFNIRVYLDANNKETVVLHTQNLRTNEPVLVRVHSECLTGDVLGSLQCDCGKQLQNALELISKNGGVLIYLRQEGRGIGLFNKIKAYDLQAKGADTAEANIMLGHYPDERTYEQVNDILNDLNIKSIRLITNNPSKISEIAKTGIEITEQVPLFIKSNKYNKAYYKTKIEKFQHSLDHKQKYYNYQFHAHSPTLVKEIGLYLKDKKTDPLLRIFVGINADMGIFGNDKEIKQYKAIFLECKKWGFTPVLHFSFQEICDLRETLQKIKDNLPFVTRLHMNDICRLKTSDLRKAYDLFEIDLPLCNENFDILEIKQFRSLIKKNDTFIFLDNSKGKGIKEGKKSMIKKIDFLLNHGINNIALCGGFGPDRLKEFFELKRYYKINFSIDAESNLETLGLYDIEKTKMYLSQLIHGDATKENHVAQTKQILARSQDFNGGKAHIMGHDFLVYKGVFHPEIFPSTKWLAKRILGYVDQPNSFCEVGCGTGVISCLVALSNTNTNVFATDIDANATDNTKKNAEILGISDQVVIYKGDVLDGIPKSQKFDFIFWSLPFGFLDPGTQISQTEQQVFDPGYRAIRKLFKTAKNYLNPSGKLLLGFSEELGHKKRLEDLAKEFNLTLKVISSTKMKESELIDFELIEGSY